MTLIGMLHHRKDPTTVLKSYAYAIVARAEGADFIYFSPNSVDIKNKTIDGYVYEKGLWKERVTRFPDVIYNAGSPEKLEKSMDIIAELQQEIPFTTVSIGNKWSVNERLKKGNEFSKYLVPSMILKEWKDLYQYLITFQDVIVKPIDGRKGQGIYFIKVSGDEFIINKDSQDTFFTKDELKHFLMDLLNGGTYIVQPYISSKTKSGQAFDLRLQAQKNGDGKWVITAIYPRIAPPGTIITNINNGGYTNYLESFLDQEYSEAEAYDMKKMLEYFTLSLARHLDKLQMIEYGEIIDEIGIDAGIDEDNKIWIYEVNWRPGCPPTFYLEMDVVKNTIQYAKYLAKNQRKIKRQIRKVQKKGMKNGDVPIIGLTGSAGKTTTKAFIASILKTRMNIFESKDYWNTTEHTKKHAKEIDSSHQAVVLEYGMAYPGVITEHCSIIQPTISAVTNIGMAHIGNFGGDIKQIAHAKSELIHGMDQKGVLFVNADDANSRHLETDQFKGKIFTTGIKKAADYKAYDVSYGDTGMHFKIKLKNKEVSFFIPVFGEHNVYNAINAIAITDYLGFTEYEIKSGVLFKKPPRRMTFYHLKKSITVIDDTVHSQPQAVLAAIDVLKNVNSSRKIAILGQMRELGDLQNEQYKIAGEYVSKQGIDILLTYGHRADKMGKAAIAAGLPAKNVRHFSSKEEMHKYLMKTLKRNDTVLVKGASKTNMFDIVKAIVDEVGEED